MNNSSGEDEKDRGQRGSFDPKTGAVHGAGAGAGGGNPGEDYDSHVQGGAGLEPHRVPRQSHPLPASEEARHDQIGETTERKKGLGDDDSTALTADPEAAAPDGSPYPNMHDRGPPR